jgi:hypothetical protein
VGIPRFLLPLRGPRAHKAVLDALAAPARLQRAIGVVYRPRTERASHYFQACLPRQFDAMIHIDTTRWVGRDGGGRVAAGREWHQNTHCGGCASYLSPHRRAPCTTHCSAVEPLERTALWTGGEEETYPSGL